jgi:hypothetical protein
MLNILADPYSHINSKFLLKLNNSISLQEEKTGTSIKSIYFVSETD